jgi:hypothetical protein
MMPIGHSLLKRPVSIAAVAAALMGPAAAEPADTFAGKQVRIIIPGGTAGGYALMSTRS